MDTFIKQCTKCKQFKDLKDFLKKRQAKDGTRNLCKECSRIYMRKNRHKYSESRKLAEAKARKEKRTYRYKYPEKMKVLRHNYYLRNKETIKEKTKKYRQENLEKMKKKRNIRLKIRRKEDILFKLMQTLRSRICSILKGKTKPSSVTKIVGCDLEKLKKHLESKFKDGMTWDNWGRKGWHIDHIKPLSKFDLTNLEELKSAAHYTNLQPLWATENMKKSNKYTEGEYQ
jgi:hypothetical protein